MFKIITLAIAIFSVTHSYANDSMGIVTSEIERINSLRESLVGGVQGEVTKDTFKAVCKPVGVQLKKFANKNNFKIKQAALKYRNENHKSNAIEAKVLKDMKVDKNLIATWKQADSGGQYYFRRIDVKPACLNCHGTKSKRPAFIKKGYPNDKAFDFEVGELRAIYSVFIPESKP